MVDPKELTSFIVLSGYFLALGFALSSFAPQRAWALTCREVIDRVQQQSGVLWGQPHNDTFVEGDPDKEITGVAVTLFPTYELLEDAAQRGLNFVLCHEPLYYDGVAQEADPSRQDPVLVEKQQFARERGITVFRFHDQIHRMTPDGIHRGVVDALDWDSGRVGPGIELFKLPETTLAALASDVATMLGAGSARVVGRPDQPVRRVALLAGAWWSKDQVKLLQRSGVDVLVVGESREWQAVEDVRDAVAQGRAKGLILVGHNASEEAGMKWCADWVGKFVTEVPVELLPSGEPYWAATAYR